MIGATMTEVGTPASTSLATRLEPLVRRARARLHGAGELAVERRDGERDLDQAALRHGAQDVEIAQDERGFGDDADGMVGGRQHFEDAPHDAVAPLDRLVGVGVGADGDGARTIGGIGQLALERSCAALVLANSLVSKSRPGDRPRKAWVGPREAIDAAMLAAAIGIDRAVEADIRRGVPGDDAPGRDLLHFGGERLELAKRLPAVVDRLIGDRLVAAGAVGRARRGHCGAPAATPPISSGKLSVLPCFLSATTCHSI